MGTVNTVSVVDTAVKTVKATVPVGSDPSKVSIENFMGTLSNAFDRSTKRDDTKV